MLKKAILIVAAMFSLIGVYSFGTSTIEAKKAFEMAKAGQAVIVDVREEDELSTGLAEPAVWMPYSKIKGESPEWAKFLKEHPKDRDVILYCAGGIRARKVVDQLVAKGYKALNMGGFGEWRSANLPIKHK